MKQTITIDKLPPTLNEWQRLHWRKRSEVKTTWAWLIKSKAKWQHNCRVDITLTRVSTAMPDPDNVAGSFKPIGDALTGANVIPDDSFEWIREFRVRWEKCNYPSEQKTIIEITDTDHYG